MLNSNLENDQAITITQQSQIFPNIKLDIAIVKTRVSNDGTFATYRLVGTLNENCFNVSDLFKLYDEIYKPIIKYSFTTFNMIYRINYTIDTKTGLLMNANASIKEQVKNNYESVSKFNLRRIEL